MVEPKIQEKRWTIDLEKKIQEEHFADQKKYNNRYSFDSKSKKEEVKKSNSSPIFIDTGIFCLHDIRSRS